MNERISDLDPEQLKQAWERVQREDEFWAENYQKFARQKKFRNKFVAVYEGDVVVVSKDLIKALRKLERLGLREKAQIRFVTNNTLNL